MKVTTIFTDERTPAGITVNQVADDPGGTQLVYPDQPSFLADGHRFLVYTSAGPAVCDPDAECSLRHLFAEGAGHEVRVTIDGKYGYYTETNSEGRGTLAISRIDLDTGKTERLYQAEGVLPGTSLPATKFNIATVSADNKRIASGMYLGDGSAADAPFGIVVLDLESGEARVIAEDRDFLNPHLQYCRSTDPDEVHDLLVQMNHGAHTDTEGNLLVALGPPSEGGVDVHVLRDDGANWRDMPFGRDGKESCIGHQIWRGHGQSAVTVTLENLDNSYGWADGSKQEVVAGWPVPADKEAAHRGRLNTGARRALLSAGFEKPRFCHLATDASGLKFVFDTFPIFDGHRAGMLIYTGYAIDEQSPLTFQYLLNSGVTFSAKSGGYHAHPIISPDGSLLLFNSNISGTQQAYLVRGVAW